MKMLMTMPVRMMLVMMMNDGDNADAGGGGDVGEATVGFMRGHSDIQCFRDFQGVHDTT